MSELQNVHSSQVAEYNPTQDKIDLLKRTVCRDADNAQFELFMHHWKRTGFDHRYMG